MRHFLSKRFCLLFCVTFLAFFLRTNRISTIPPSLSWDEVSIGYNAYSILKTGRDEHERFLPFDTFIAYGDYKPPLPIYFTVPFVAFFGLNELSVRLPSALFGTLTVFLTYFLVQELFGYGLRVTGSKKELTRHASLVTLEHLPFLSSFLLAISPWHINLSRAGFEANIALFFIVIGVFVILKASQFPKMWVFVWIPFVISLYTFNSSRYFAPLLGLGLLVISRNSIRKNKRYFLIGICLAILLMLSLIPHLFSKEARLRYAEVNIFSDPSVVITSNKRIEEAKGAWWAKILFNRRVGYMRSYASHFLDHFQPEYLFIKGDGNPKFSIQDVGQLYTIEAPFLAIGILSMLAINPTIALFLLFWLVMAIVPAAVARETPHALRTLNSLPTWQIFIAYGILTVVLSIKYKVSSITNTKLLTIFCFSLIVIYGFSIMYYLHNYYIHYPKEFSGEWQYGYKQALQFIQPIEKNYDTIYITESIGRPYMYTLFYYKPDPSEFFRIKDTSFDATGFYHVYGFGKYRFVKDMPDQCKGRCLFVAPTGSESKKEQLLHTVRLLNDNPVLDIYEK